MGRDVQAHLCIHLWGFCCFPELQLSQPVSIQLLYGPQLLRFQPVCKVRVQSLLVDAIILVQAASWFLHLLSQSAAFAASFHPNFLEPHMLHFKPACNKREHSLPVATVLPVQAASWVLDLLSQSAVFAARFHPNFLEPHMLHFQPAYKVRKHSLLVATILPVQAASWFSVLKMLTLQSFWFLLPSLGWSWRTVKPQMVCKMMIPFHSKPHWNF